MLLKKIFHVPCKEKKFFEKDEKIAIQFYRMVKLSLLLIIFVMVMCNQIIFQEKKNIEI
jgi:hypothetical protein